MDDNKDNYKLRIKHPSGAEFEAVGPENFILEQKKDFIVRFGSAAAPEAETETGHAPIPLEGLKRNVWDEIIDFKEGVPFIPLKTPELKTGLACLIIMAGFRALKKEESISAIKLSRAIKLSGFNPKRLDREISKEMREGAVSAFGTRRNRTYRINQKGVEEAYLKTLKILKKANEDRNG